MGSNQDEAIKRILEFIKDKEVDIFFHHINYNDFT